MKKEAGGPETSAGDGSRGRSKGGDPRTERIRNPTKRRRLKELKPKPPVGPLLQRLLNGDWASGGEITEEIRKGEEITRSVSVMVRNLKEKARIILTADDIKRDAGVVQEAKVKMGELKDHAQNRDAMREAGMTIEVSQMLGERNPNSK